MLTVVVVGGVGGARAVAGAGPPLILALVALVALVVLVTGCSAGQDILSGDLAALDLGDAAQGDAHTVGDVLLGQAAASPARSTWAVRMSFQATWLLIASSFR